MNESFPPGLLTFSGNYADIAELTERAHQIFSNDFISSQPKFLGKQVRTNFLIKEGNKEEGFWHVTTRDYFKDGNRDPEGDRLIRIRWIRACIENYQHSKMCYFAYPEGSGKMRHYFWLKEQNYLVVLEENRTFFSLVTAYIVDRRYMIEDLERKYRQSQQT
jgi:hypothetical protein